MPGPVGMEEITSGLINPLVGMGTEIVPLGLKQICRELFSPITVKKRECCADCVGLCGLGGLSGLGGLGAL